MEYQTGRFLFIKGLLKDQMVMLASVYAPNQNQICFTEQTLQHLNKFKEGHLIITTKVDKNKIRWNSAK